MAIDKFFRQVWSVCKSIKKKVSLRKTLTHHMWSTDKYVCKKKILNVQDKLLNHSIVNGGYMHSLTLYLSFGSSNSAANKDIMSKILTNGDKIF